MDEIISLLESLIGQAGDLADELSTEEMDAVLNVFSQAVQFIQQETERQQQPIPAEEPYGTDLLWNLSNGNPEVFVNYLQTVPDPALNQLLRNPEQLKSTIENLSRRFPMAKPEQIEGVQQAPINSSNIWGFSYDPKQGSLKVRFQGDGIYQYEGVPPYIFKIFQAGAVAAKTEGQNQFGAWWRSKQPSLGASFYELIRKGQYPYQKIA